MLVILRGRVKIWRTQHSSTGSRQAPGDRENDINGKQERSNLSVNEGGDIDAMLTECVGEVTNGGALLEAEAALGLTSPYTAIVAMCSTDAGESGKSGDERESQATHQSCEMLCITGEALSGKRRKEEEIRESSSKASQCVSCLIIHIIHISVLHTTSCAFVMGARVTRGALEVYD